MWKNSKIRIYILVVLFVYQSIANSENFEKDNEVYLIKSYYPLLIPDRIEIEIRGKNYIKYLKQIKNVGQKKNLNSNLVNFEKKKWVKGRIKSNHNNKFLPIDIILHGDFNDHISLPYSSLRIKLKNEFFYNVKDFILFKPKTRRYESEVFGTLFLNKIGILAPYTKYISLKLNENLSEEYIFQEKISKYFIERNGLREEPILEYDEKNKWNKYLLNLPNTPKFDFYKIENTDYLVSLEKIKKVFFATTLKQLNYNNNFTNDLFETSLLLMGGCHGLAEHNRKYYFDSLKNDFLPIYYDGMLFYDQNKDICQIERQEYKIKISNNVIKYLKKKINDKTFKNELKNEFLKSIINKDIEKFNFYWKYIETNLLKLENLASNNDTKIEKEKKESSISEKLKNLDLPYPLIFYYNDIEDNNFKLCYDWQKFNEQIFLNFNKEKFFKKNYQGCHVIDKSKLIELFKNKISYTTNLNNKLVIFPILIGNVYNDRLFQNSIDIQYKKLNLNKNSKVYTFDLENNSIYIVDIPEKVNLDKLIINSSVNNDSSIILKINNAIIKNLEFNQINKTKATLNKNAQIKNVTGCMNIIDSKFTIDEIKINGSNCEDGLNIVRSEGKIKKINVINAISDGVDFDYSKIKVDISNFSDVKGDCVDLSFGKYEFLNLTANQCGDKGVSVGENSILYVDNLIVDNAKIGLASKDSSKAYLENLTINNVENCLSAYNKKQEFNGGNIDYSKMNCQNYSVLFEIDKQSFITKKNLIKESINE